MLVGHLGGLQGFIEDGGGLLWTIDYSYSRDKWTTTYYPNSYGPEKVYMTEKVARKVVDMLNNKEYAL